MTREEAIADIRDNIKPIVGGKSLDMAIKALEQEPCEDCVNRQAAIKAFNAFADEVNQDTDIHEAIEIMLNLPSVTPQTKTGYWIDTGSGQECSECGEIQYGYDSFRKYCANCGIKMEVYDATDN